MPCTSPNCDSSDAMAVYEQTDGSHDGFCFSCGYYDEDPLGHDDSPLLGDKSSSDVRPNDGPQRASVSTMLTVNQISECPTRSIPSRKITQETADFYSVRTLLNGVDGQTPVALAFPYYKYNIYNTLELSGFKKRSFEGKEFISIGDTKDTLLFGESLFSGGKRLYITEGEIDTLSLFQALKSSYSKEFSHLNPAVVSLPHGARSAAQVLSNRSEFLSKFKEIYLVFDNDEQGQEAVERCCSFLDPDKTFIVDLPLKDANDMLMANRSQELVTACLTGAKKYVPSGITTSRKLLQDALTPPERGLDWPWPTLTRLTYGRHPGIYGIGAGVGVGKTEFFHELIHHITRFDRSPVGVFLLEEAPQRTLQILAGKELNVPLHIPDTDYDHEDAERVLGELSADRERIYIFDHRGDRTWETIYGQCKYLAAVQGVRDIFLDPLTAIISHEENTDRALHKLMADIAVLITPPYNCRVYYSSHLNEPPKDSRPHEEGGRVKEAHFAGSRAMIRFSDYIFALERNKQDPEVVKRNTTTFRVLKDRKTGQSTGEIFDIYYDSGTGRYLEPNLVF